MGRRLALIIGNSTYRDGTLARLPTPDIHFGSLAETLLDPEVDALEDPLAVKDTGHN